MSERINIRLPDDLVVDCKAWAKSQGITLTDMIIAGLQSQLQVCRAMAAPEIVSVASPGDTVYEPDPVKPIKTPKLKVNAAPVVRALLSGISKQATVTHHPTCKCGVCRGHLSQASEDDLAGVRRRRCEK